MLFVSEFSVVAFEGDGLFGLAGLDDVLDAGLGLGLVLDDLLAERLAAVLVDLAELAGFLLAALAGLLGVLKSGSVVTVVKLSSLMGETDDLLLAVDFLEELDDALVADLFVFAAEDEGFFFIEEGVVLALDDAFGRGVPFIGLDARFAGVVVVCLAIVDQLCVSEAS